MFVFAIIYAIIALVSIIVGILFFGKHARVLGKEGAAEAILAKNGNNVLPILGYFVLSMLMLTVSVWLVATGALQLVFSVIVFAMLSEILGGSLVELGLAYIFAPSAKVDVTFVAA